MKTGLSYFQDGGATGDEDTSVAPLSKPIAAKGRYGVAAPVGAVPLGESVLENMQRIIDEKKAQQGSLLESLKDATAWTAGGTSGPWQALSQRQKDREEQAAELFQLQNALASQKAAQAQLAKVRAGDTASGWGPAGAPTAASSTAAPTVASGFPAEVVAQYNRILDTEGIAAANKFKNEQLKISSQYQFNPQLDQIVEFPVNGQLQSMTLRQAKTLAERDPQLKALLDRTYPGVTSTPAAAPAQAAPVSTTPSPAASAASSPAAPTAPKPAAPVQAAPVVSSGVTSGGAKSTSAIKNQMEIEKEGEVARAKARVGNEEDRLNALIDQSKKATDRIDTAARISAIADSDPEMFGVLVKPGVSSSIGTLLKEGIKVGTHGQIALPSIEQIIRNNVKGATPEKLSRAREMEGYLRKVELDFSSAFKGQGAVSDNERKIVQAIAGSTSDPADLLGKKAAWMTMSAEKDKAIGQAWRDFQSRFGGNVSFSKFENSKEYRQIVENHEQRLRQQFEKEIKSYGNKPLVTAEEYERGMPSTGKPSTSAKGKALVNKYLTK